MPQFAIATAAYPTNPSFVADFVTGVAAASSGQGDVKLIVAAEYGFEAAAALGRLPAGVMLDLRPASKPMTPAGLRRVMVEAAVQSEAEIVVFADFDDRLLPEALDLHAEALADAAISYGDMELIDEKGHSLGRRFYEGTGVPAHFIGNSAIADRNFIGFTNSAIRSANLKSEIPPIPDTVAAADWWFYTMILASGVRANQTRRKVTDYRVRRESIVGHTISANPTVLRQRALLALNHYAALSDELQWRTRHEAIARLVAAIDQDVTDGLIDIISEMANKPIVWFEDVGLAAAGLFSGKSEIAKACL